MSVNSWGVNDGANFAIPMGSAVPANREQAGLVLTWDPVSKTVQYLNQTYATASGAFDSLAVYPPGTIGAAIVSALAVNNLPALLIQPTGGNLVGVLHPIVGAVASTLNNWIAGQTPNAGSDFDAPPDGVLSAQAALMAGIGAINFVGSKQRGFIIPAGIYIADQLVWNDLFDCHIQFQGVILSGNAAFSRDSLLKIKNAHNITIDGSLTLDCGGNANYDHGVFISAEPGGTLAPATGLVTRVRWDGLTVSGAKIGVRIGSPAIDAQCSEITFNGYNPIKCPTALYIAGSQTGASFVGGNIISETHSSLPAAPQWAIIMDGGFLSIAGGELGHMLNSTNGTIWMRPCTSALYGNPYPILRMSGTHIETAAMLLVLANPFGLAAPDSSASEFTLSNCSGYVSNSIDALPFIDIEDGSYAGLVSVKQARFYKSAGAATRTAPNINCYGALTNVSIDRESFGRGFQHWMGGVTLGKLLHGQEIIAHVESLGGATYSTAQTPFKCTAKNTGGQLDRYVLCYNSGTGIFTVPAGGLKTLQVKATCQTAGLAGSIFVKRGAALSGFGQVIDTIARVDITLVNLAAGETVTVFLQPTTAVTFGNSASDNITFTASN